MLMNYSTVLHRHFKKFCYQSLPQFPVRLCAVSPSRDLLYPVHPSSVSHLAVIAHYIRKRRLLLQAARTSLIQHTILMTATNQHHVLAITQNRSSPSSVSLFAVASLNRTAPNPDGCTLQRHCTSLLHPMRAWSGPLAACPEVVVDAIGCVRDSDYKENTSDHITRE